MWNGSLKFPFANIPVRYQQSQGGNEGNPGTDSKIEGSLKNIIAYATGFLDSLIQKVKANEELGRGKRKTKVGSFEKVDMKEVVKRDQELRYDSATGYLGTAVSGGQVVAEVSSFDRI